MQKVRKLLQVVPEEHFGQTDKQKIKQTDKDKQTKFLLTSHYKISWLLQVFNSSYILGKDANQKPINPFENFQLHSFLGM